MKLRALRQWPALFVAVLAFVAGPMAYGSDDRSVTAFVSGALVGDGDDDGGGGERELHGTLDEVAALCRKATARTEGGHIGARECRELADAIDAVVARAMERPGHASDGAQRAMAGLVLAAEAMRSADNRIRKAALSGLTRASAVPAVANVPDRLV